MQIVGMNTACGGDPAKVERAKHMARKISRHVDGENAEEVVNSLLYLLRAAILLSPNPLDALDQCCGGLRAWVMDDLVNGETQ